MSSAIRRLYTSKGLEAPRGKGIHTRKFHEVVSGIMASGSSSNPYAVAMSKLGRDRAVKRSHWGDGGKKRKRKLRNIKDKMGSG